MSKFANASFKSRETGATVTGEFVVESSNAWQVAVDGKVRVLMKEEWQTFAPAPRGFADYFADMYGGR